MRTFGPPIPDWFTPAVDMTMKKMAKDSPASFLELGKNPDFKNIVQGRTKELLEQYQARVESLVSEGADPVNAHYAATEEIWG